MVNVIWVVLIFIAIIYSLLTGQVETINNGILTHATSGVNLIMEMMPLIVLWTGIMKIAEKSGLLHVFARALNPLLRRLFPSLPRNHKALGYIASNIGNDVRQLEGSITRLVAYSAIMCVTNITTNFAMEALKDFVKKDAITDQNNIRRIQKSVANFYKISFEDMKSKKRTPNLAIPRQVAMYLCRKLTDESFERIGIEFSGKNHATVIHACNKIEREMQINKELKDAINDIEKQLT